MRTFLMFDRDCIPTLRGSFEKKCKFKLEKINWEGKTSAKYNTFNKLKLFPEIILPPVFIKFLEIKISCDTSHYFNMKKQL